MSETAEITTSADRQRDRGGRFVIGGIPGPGRPRGARSKLSEAFLQDLHAVWEKRGMKALEQCATKKPAEFVRVIASLMPQDISLSVAVDVTDFAQKFRTACELLGNAEPPQPRRPLRDISRAKVIDHVR
jgi:hypothetical protein